MLGGAYIKLAEGVRINEATPSEGSNWFSNMLNQGTSLAGDAVAGIGNLLGAAWNKVKDVGRQTSYPSDEERMRQLLAAPDLQNKRRPGLRGRETTAINARDRFGTSYHMDENGRVWRYARDPKTGKSDYIRTPHLDSARMTPEQQAAKRAELEKWYEQKFMEGNSYQRVLASGDPQAADRAYAQIQGMARKAADHDISLATRNKAAKEIGLKNTGVFTSAAQKLGLGEVSYDQSGMPYVIDPQTNKPRRLSSTEIWRAHNPEAAARRDAYTAKLEANYNSPTYMANLLRTYQMSNTPLPDSLKRRMADPAMAERVSKEMGRLEAERRAGATFTDQQMDRVAPSDPSVAQQIIDTRQRKGMPPPLWADDWKASQQALAKNPMPAPNAPQAKPPAKPVAAAPAKPATSTPAPKPAAKPVAKAAPTAVGSTVSPGFYNVTYTR